MYAYVLVGISHAGADPVAFVEQSADDPPSDEAGGAGNGDSASLRNGRHAVAARWPWLFDAVRRICEQIAVVE